MALRRQNLSPTANLLRNSRLFSVPNPLPSPSVAITYGAGMQKVSDTATLPYPTHQAIATTKSSLARGDWGLKRPLPSRSYLVQTSDPVLRVKQLDTIEHITDFDSAADHVRTRQKWEEMGIPMMKGMAQMRENINTGSRPDGAFERRADVTAYEGQEGLDEAGMYLEAIKESVRRKRNVKSSTEKEGGSAPAPFVPFTPPQPDAARHNTHRWKHEGPWLPGMNADDFTTYLTRAIAKRRDEFNKYLVEYVKNEIYTTRQLASRKSGSVPLDTQEADTYHANQEKEWATISQEDVAAGIKALRRETAVNPLNSKLVQKLIIPFLRLPAIKFKDTTYGEDNTRNDFESYRFDDEKAPLSTHPSAGLGYVRTGAYLTNHPILGPQAAPTPVPARVVQPRATSTSTESYARLGVAGFVTNDEHRNTGKPMAHQTGRDVETIDVVSEGGKKLPVQPHFGSVTNDGRIHIKLSRSSGAEVQVARGALEDRPPVRDNAYGGTSIQDLLADTGRNRFKEVDGRNPKASQQQFETLMNEVNRQRETHGQRQNERQNQNRRQPSTQRPFDDLSKGLEEAMRGDPNASR